MSKVASFLIDAGPKKTQVLKAIRDVFQLGYADIQENASASTPLVIRPLFDRANRDFPESLLGLLLKLNQLGAAVATYQLLDHQCYDAENKYYEITADRLRNAIVANRQSLAEQRFLGSLEGTD
ncbi:hypothetical protein CLU95_4661 [Variovorax sp. 54]|uniref:hypothetical protein n=1 Tax=Variovorax sp. 54 TaxID=2035212 RepID=UPI000C17FDC9|nr:hypothetical protein [Variovorax sp. 54]PIF77487.1 hypothetical protein CLU95_4661 [Variovorax sp. 54]